MNDKIVKKTQDTLGKIIKKPPLTDKLLNKPPFRFLHDVTTSVIKSTGFMQGLYSDDELNSDNVKDKDSKIAFLQKSIDLVGLVTERSVPARPSKIVAGHEPEKTNEFLQMLADAVSKGVDNDEYVKRVLAGEKGGGGGGKSEKPPTGSKEKKDEKRSRDKSSRRDRDKEPAVVRSRDPSQESGPSGKPQPAPRRGSQENRRARRAPAAQDGKDARRKNSLDPKESNPSTSRGGPQDDVPDGTPKRRERRGHDRAKEDRKNDDDKDRKKHRRDDDKRSRDRERSKDRGSRDKDRDHDKEKDKDRDKDRKERHRDRDKDDKRHRDRDRDRDHEDGGERRKGKGKGESKGKKEKVKAEAQKDVSTEDKKKGKEAAAKAEKTEKRHRDKDKEEDKENEDAHATQNGEKEEAEKPKKESKRKEKQTRKETDEAEGGGAGEEEEVHRQEREKEERQKRREEPMVNGAAEEEGSQAAAPRPRMARPSSARPAPPRIKKNEPAAEEPHIVGQGAVPMVITDKNDDSDDDDDNFIAKEEELPPPVEMEQAPTTNAEMEEDGDHGGLVKKILETRKELEGGSQQASKVQKKTEIERSPANDAAKRKEREMVQKEIDKLRSTIQTLTRSANPLGKIMDYIQEDLDQMQKELEMWKQEHKENTLALQREQSITENSVEPLKAQLGELDQAISDKLDLIATVKSNILKNDDRIEKMLSTVTKS